MSSAIDGVYRALAPLRLYALREDSLIDRELAAYDAAFAVAEELLAEIERQAFVQTADGSALTLHEKTVGLAPREALEIETRRELVLYRLGAAPFDFDREGMVNSIRATGMEAELIEDPLGESITVRCLRIIDPSLDLDSLSARVRAVLPAHLDASFDIGDLTWDLFEAREITWDAWNAENMTWSDFDLNGHNLFRN